jgi:16S rRNA processing protein RimM
LQKSKLALLPNLMPKPPDDLIVLGRITGSYGVKGWIRIQSFDKASTSNLLKTNDWWLLPRGVETDKPVYTEFKVVEARAHSGDIVAQVSTITQPEAAKTLTGAQIAVSRQAFQPTTKLDEYYWVDLIGCQVRNRQQVVLGIVSAVDDHGAHAFLKIQPPAIALDLAAQGEATQAVFDVVSPQAVSSVDVLIPFVASYIDEVLLPQRLILVDWELDWQN